MERKDTASLDTFKVEKVGSCSTLVAEKILSDEPDIQVNHFPSFFWSKMLLNYLKKRTPPSCTWSARPSWLTR